MGKIGCLLSIFIVVVCFIGLFTCINSCSDIQQNQNKVDHVKVLVVKKNFREGRKGRTYYDVVFETEQGVVFSRPVSREMYNIYDENKYYYLDNVRKMYIGEEESDEDKSYFVWGLIFISGILLTVMVWVWKIEDDCYSEY